MEELKIQEPVVIQAELKKQHEYKLLGTGKKRNGLKLFELDMATGKIREVPIESRKTYDPLHRVAKNKAVINPNNMYLWALNAKNAKRKFLLRLK